MFIYPFIVGRSLTDQFCQPPLRISSYWLICTPAPRPTLGRHAHATGHLRRTFARPPPPEQPRGTRWFPAPATAAAAAAASEPRWGPPPASPADRRRRRPGPRSTPSTSMPIRRRDWSWRLSRSGTAATHSRTSRRRGRGWVTCQKNSEASRYGWLFVLFWLVLPAWLFWNLCNIWVLVAPQLSSVGLVGLICGMYDYLFNSPWFYLHDVGICFLSDALLWSKALVFDG